MTKKVISDHPSEAGEFAKWQRAAEQAKKTATWAKTMTAQLISSSHALEPRWRVINFVGPKKSESRGIVDLMAIRRMHRDVPSPYSAGDLFEIVLVQVKGGSAAWPSASDRARLRAVRAHYSAKAVLLSEWKKGAKPKLYRLTSDEWVQVDAFEVFAPSHWVKAQKALAKKAVAKEASPKLRPTNASRSQAAKKAWVKRKANAAEASAHSAT